MSERNFKKVHIFSDVGVVGLWDAKKLYWKAFFVCYMYKIYNV